MKNDLPELPSNYRWRIERNDSNPDYDAVTLYLEKLTKTWWGQNWQPIFSKYIRRTLLDDSLRVKVLKEAQEFYDQEFGLTESAEIAGIYRGTEPEE